MSLIQTFPPEPDEAPLGYYRRLSSRNQLFNWKDIAAIAGVSRYRSSLLGQPTSVALGTGIKPEWAQALHDKDLWQRKWHSLYKDGVDCLCPQCIETKPYIRSWWEHGFVTACPEHQCGLIDTCDSCGESLASTRQHIEHCACGRDLRHIKTPPATGGRLWLSQLISGVSTQGFGDLPKLGALETSSVVGLVQALCQLHHPSATAIPRNAGLPTSLDASIHFLAPLEVLLSNWPRNFESHIRDRISQGQPSARTVSSLLGPWYQKLKRFCSGNQLEPFLEVVARVCAVHAPHLVCLDLTAPLVQEASGYLLLREASKALGIRAEVLARAIETGAVVGRTKPFGSQRTLYELHAPEIERIQDSRQQWGTEQQACEKLGVPASVLTLMVDANLVDADPSWKSDLLKGGRYSLRSIDALIVRLLGVARQPRADDTIDLRAINSRFLGERKSLVRLLKAIGNGQISPLTGPAHNVGLLRFKREEVAQILGSAAVEAGLTITKLAALTGWKHESISHWIKIGLLTAETVMLRGQPCRVIMPAQLLCFNRAYMPTADLARQLGWKASSLSLKLPSLKIHGAQLLSNGAHRGGLVALADLAANAANHLASA